MNNQTSKDLIPDNLPTIQAYQQEFANLESKKYQELKEKEGQRTQILKEIDYLQRYLKTPDFPELVQKHFQEHQSLTKEYKDKDQQEYNNKKNDLVKAQKLEINNAIDQLKSELKRQQNLLTEIDNHGRFVRHTYNLKMSRLEGLLHTERNKPEYKEYLRQKRELEQKEEEERKYQTRRALKVRSAQAAYQDLLNTQNPAWTKLHSQTIERVREEFPDISDEEIGIGKKLVPEPENLPPPQILTPSTAGHRPGTIGEIALPGHDLRPGTADEILIPNQVDQPVGELITPSSPEYGPQPAIAVPTGSVRLTTPISRSGSPVIRRLTSSATKGPANVVTSPAKQQAENLAKKGIGQLTKGWLLKLGGGALGIASGVGAALYTGWQVGHFLARNKEMVLAMFSYLSILLGKLLAMIGTFLGALGTIAGGIYGFLVGGPLGAVGGGALGGWLGFQAQQFLAERLGGFSPFDHTGMASEASQRLVHGAPKPIVDASGRVIGQTPRIGGLSDILPGHMPGTNTVPASMVAVPLFGTLGMAAFGTFFVAMHLMTAFTVPNSVGTIPAQTPGFPSPGPIPSGFPIPTGPPLPLPPPTQCFTFDNGLIPWSAQKLAEAKTAANELQSTQSTYVTKLCNAAGTILLQYGDGLETYCGYNKSATLIYLYDCSTNGITTYTLAHETGHSFAKLFPEVYQEFRFSGIIQQEGHLCSYPGNYSENEDFAEMVGVYAAMPSVLQGTYTVFDPPGPEKPPHPQSDCHPYPLHQTFAQDNIFN